jgi:tetratricopeptide (TPR) repeat protein
VRWVLAAVLFTLPAFAQPVPPELPPDVTLEFERVQPLIAEKKLTEALGAARKAYDLANAARLESAVRARLLDEIGSVQSMLGNYVDAEATYRRALELREQSGQLSDPGIAWTLNGLASALIAQGRTRDADAVARRALAIVDASSSPDDLTLLMALTNRMLLAIALGNDDDFNAMQRRMADMTIRLPHPQPRHRRSSRTRICLRKEDCSRGW